MLIFCDVVFFTITSVLSFFFKYTATTEIYTYLHTLSLHDALPILLLNPASRSIHPLLMYRWYCPRRSRMANGVSRVAMQPNQWGIWRLVAHCKKSGQPIYTAAATLRGLRLRQSLAADMFMLSTQQTARRLSPLPPLLTLCLR